VGRVTNDVERCVARPHHDGGTRLPQENRRPRGSVARVIDDRARHSVRRFVRRALTARSALAIESTQRLTLHHDCVKAVP
jgi:hypothetical protein